MAKKSTPLRKFRPLIIFAAIFIVAYIGFLQVFNRRFVPTNYDNGKGLSMSLRFFPNSTVAPMSSLLSIPAGATNTGLKGIVSPPFDDDQIALVVYAVVANTPDLTPCAESAGFDVTIGGSKRPVCQVVNKTTKKPSIYHVSFRQGGKRYTAFAMLDYDLKKAAASKPDAARITGKIDMSQHKQDVAQIFASIEPK